MKKNNSNNVNIFNYIPKKYGNYIFDETTKYQKQYGFDMGTGEHATWNNEADAFKHAYMQAQLSLLLGKNISKVLGDFHEFQGNKIMGQDDNEYNMDNWNNNQGREIAKEIIRDYGPQATVPSAKINDIIAEKVMQRMKAGQLITNPNDARKYMPNKRNNITGQAASIDYIDKYIFSPEEIGKMSLEEFQANEEEIMNQYEQGLIKPRDVRGNIYVNSYTRSDGTQVSGYYRSK